MRLRGFTIVRDDVEVDIAHAVSKSADACMRSPSTCGRHSNFWFDKLSLNGQPRRGGTAIGRGDSLSVIRIEGTMYIYAVP